MANTTPAIARPLATATAMTAAIALLLAAANYTLAVLADISEPFTALLIYALALASFSVAVVAGSTAANLVSALVAGKPHRPGHVLGFNHDYSYPHFDQGAGPFSKTQIVLLALIALAFMPPYIWQVYGDTQTTLTLLMFVPLGLMIGIIYRL